MKVLNLSYNDYANFNYMNCRALRSVGVECEALTMTPHVFGYSHAAKLATRNEIRIAACGADVIQIFHTSDFLLNLVDDLRKRIFVYHTGTIYRQKPDKYNSIFNPVVERTFIDSPEFFHLGAKNVTYIATAIDTNEIRLRPSGNDWPIFAHYPSLPDTKGTMKIMELMGKVDGVNFLVDTSKVNHDQNLERMARCDVYVELFSPLQNGQPYGSFGVTAFEAAAMGKSVITNSLFHDVYRNTYGIDGWLNICNTEREFVEMVRRIHTNGIAPERPAIIRKWIEDYHSLKATGEYLLKFL